MSKIGRSCNTFSVVDVERVDLDQTHDIFDSLSAKRQGLEFKKAIRRDQAVFGTRQYDPKVLLLEGGRRHDRVDNFQTVAP